MKIQTTKNATKQEHTGIDRATVFNLPISKIRINPRKSWSKRARRCSGTTGPKISGHFTSYFIYGMPSDQFKKTSLLALYAL